MQNQQNKRSSSKAKVLEKNSDTAKRTNLQLHFNVQNHALSFSLSEIDIHPIMGTRS